MHHRCQELAAEFVKKRVLQVLPNLSVGGAETMAVNLARELNREDFEPFLLSLYPPVGSVLEATLAEAGVTVIHLHKRKGLDLRAARDLARTVRELHLDVVHTHLRTLSYQLWSQVSDRRPVRVHTVHSVATREAGRFGRVLQNVALRLGATPVAIAEEVRATISEVYGREAPIIPNGIPVTLYARSEVERAAMRNEFSIGEDTLVLISVANLHPSKNHAGLITAFARARGYIPRNTRLMLVGEGTQRAALEQQITTEGLTTHVTLLGSRADIPRLLSGSDIFVSASLVEGNPLSVMEAMAAGLPTIAPRVGGVPELITNGCDGLLVTPGDIESLANTMVDVATDGAQARRLGTSAAATANERFTIGAMARSYEELYLKLIQRSRS